MIRAGTGRPTLRNGGLAFAALLLATAAAAQTVQEVRLIEPEDGAVVGKRPRFRIGVDGTDIPKMKFRIELSRDGFDSMAYTFDQMDEPNGWGYITAGFDEPGALYWCRKPLEDGTYQWRAAAWNGLEWVASEDEFELVVDAVPPAPVENLRVRWDAEREAVVLEWDPVAVDLEGRPETVVRYHVYRYYKPMMFFVIRPFHVAEVEATWYEDRDVRARTAPMVFYKVTAEDAAGNETGRKY